MPKRLPFVPQKLLGAWQKKKVHKPLTAHHAANTLAVWYASERRVPMTLTLVGIWIGVVECSIFVRVAGRVRKHASFEQCRRRQQEQQGSKMHQMMAMTTTPIKECMSLRELSNRVCSIGACHRLRCW